MQSCRSVPRSKAAAVPDDFSLCLCRLPRCVDPIHSHQPGPYPVSQGRWLACLTYIPDLLAGKAGHTRSVTHPRHPDTTHEEDRPSPSPSISFRLLRASPLRPPQSLPNTSWSRSFHQRRPKRFSIRISDLFYSSAVPFPSGFPVRRPLPLAPKQLVSAVIGPALRPPCLCGFTPSQPHLAAPPASAHIARRLPLQILLLCSVVRSERLSPSTRPKCLHSVRSTRRRRQTPRASTTCQRRHLYHPSRMTLHNHQHRNPSRCHLNNRQTPPSTRPPRRPERTFLPAAWPHRDHCQTLPSPTSPISPSFPRRIPRNGTIPSGPESRETRRIWTWMTPTSMSNIRARPAIVATIQEMCRIRKRRRSVSSAPTSLHVH